MTVLSEADLVAGLDAGRVVPGVGGVGQHLAAQEGFDAAVFQQRLPHWIAGKVTCAPSFVSA